MTLVRINKKYFIIFVLVLSLFNYTATFGAVEYLELSDGSIKGLWHLNGDSVDSSGSANNGTNTNIGFGEVYGKLGEGANLNGTNSKINFGTNSLLNPTSNFSVSCWAKLNDTATKFEGIFTTVHSDTNYTNFTLFRNNSDNLVKFFLYTGSGQTSFSADSNSALNDTNYHHYVGTYNGTTAKLYIDNVLQTDTGTGTMGIGSGKGAQIGTLFLNTNDYYWNGNVDECVYFPTKTLSSDEVNALWNGGDGVEVCTTASCAVSQETSTSSTTINLLENTDIYLPYIFDTAFIIGTAWLVFKFIV